MFRLVTTLCECGGTPNMVVTLEDTFVPFIILHLISHANCITKVSKVQPKSWHVVVAKLHDLPTQLAMDWANVILGVVVVHNEEGIFQLRGALPISFDPIGYWISIMLNH
jgi:hypothetical protein